MNTTVKNMLLATAGAAVLMAGSSVMGSADSKITIKSGDTLSQLAVKYDATVEDLVASNNIKDANKIWAGDKLVISGKSAKDLKLTAEQQEVVAEVKEEAEVMQAEQAPATPAATATAAVEAPVDTEVNTDVAVSNNNATISTPSAAVSGRSGNAYMAGQCTAYVYDRASFVGSYWGNANEWVGKAAAAGRSISGTPTVGSVVVFAPGQGGAGALGHVAVVTAVNGGQISIAEGNYAGMAENFRTISGAGLTYIA